MHVMLVLLASVFFLLIVCNKSRSFHICRPTYIYVLTFENQSIVSSS